MKQCRQNILDRLPAITQAMINQAEDGSCPHAKFLFDVVSATQAKAKDGDEHDITGPSLAELLLARLELLDEEHSGPLPENAMA